MTTKKKLAIARKRLANDAAKCTKIYDKSEKDLKVMRAKIGRILCGDQKLFEQYGDELGETWEDWVDSNLVFTNAMDVARYIWVGEAVADPNVYNIMLNSPTKLTAFYEIFRPRTLKVPRIRRKLLKRAKTERLKVKEVKDYIEIELAIFNMVPLTTQQKQQAQNWGIPSTTLPNPNPTRRRSKKMPWRSSRTVWDLSAKQFVAMDDFLRKYIGETTHVSKRTGALSDEKNKGWSGNASIFPPALAREIILRYADGLPKPVQIVDPFAGGPPRALAATMMGHEYEGWEVSKKQISFNKRILRKHKLEGATFHPSSGVRMKERTDGKKYSLCLTCPPYFDLEEYGGEEDDLSHIENYLEFDREMGALARTLFGVMEDNAFVCMVVGDFRNKEPGGYHGELIPFAADTLAHFQQVGFQFVQEIIIHKKDGTAFMRARKFWEGGRKLVPVHEKLLVFKKLKAGQKMSAEYLAATRLMRKPRTVVHSVPLYKDGRRHQGKPNIHVLEGPPHEGMVDIANPGGPKVKIPTKKVSPPKARKGKARPKKAPKRKPAKTATAGKK